MLLEFNKNDANGNIERVYLEKDSNYCKENGVKYACVAALWKMGMHTTLVGVTDQKEAFDIFLKFASDFGFNKDNSNLNPRRAKIKNGEIFLN